MFERFALRQRVLNRLWYVTPTVPMLVSLSAETIAPVLQESATPSQKRLHLRDLFRRGRRYQIEAKRGGFTIQTSSKDYWRYTEGMFRLRRRTRSTCTLNATTRTLNDDLTQLDLRAHIRPTYLLDVLWLPAFITSILVFMPWSWWFMLISVGVMVGLSFVYHYFHALYQANEMLFFVETALKEHLIDELPTLEANTVDMIQTQQGFEQAWEQFYRSQKGNTQSPD